MTELRGEETNVQPRTLPSPAGAPTSGPADIVDPRRPTAASGAITDDKQMTLLTAETLVQATDRLFSPNWRFGCPISRDDCGLTHPARDPPLTTAFPV